MAYAATESPGVGRSVPQRPSGAVPSTPTVSRWWLPAGELGSRETLRRMAELARAALVEPAVIDTAAAIVAGASNPVAQVARIRDYLARHVRFLRDPVGVELLRAPRYVLGQIAAKGAVQMDCDDVATLGAALGLAVGLPARMIAVGFRGPEGPLTHVFTELLAGGRWRELDTTRPAQGIRGSPITRRLMWRV